MIYEGMLIYLMSRQFTAIFLKFFLPFLETELHDVWVLWRWVSFARTLPRNILESVFQKKCRIRVTLLRLDVAWISMD